MADHQWRRLFEEHRVSGLSIAAFCGQRGLAVSTFFARRASLLRGQGLREGESAARLGEVKDLPRFVEVKVEGADSIPKCNDRRGKKELGEVAADASAATDGGDGVASHSRSPLHSSSPSPSASPSSSPSSSPAVAAGGSSSGGSSHESFSSSSAAASTTAASTEVDVDAIELFLCGDVVVRVRAGFNASLLRQVVASLRGLR